MSNQPSSGEAPPKDQAEAAAELPRCRCGNDINSREVQLEPAYTGFGWFLFTVGITATPKWADYRCIRCRQILGRTRDPKVRKFD